MNTTAQKTTYDLKSLKLPHLKGFALRIMVRLLESPARALLSPALLKNAGITRFRSKQVDELPTLYPLYYSHEPAPENPGIPQESWPGTYAERGPGFRFESVHDFARAYRRGSITPEDVARKLLEIIETSDASDPPLRAFIAVDRDDILQQAMAAGERIRDRRALSLLDGVPIAIKDEVYMRPYPTTVGTSFLRTTVREDSTVVARLRAAGALLIGKANMHEIGIGVTGLNLHHGTPRNPYNPGNFTGGSSSGCGAAVAAGFCPASIGADGGGSIRIPAAFCGLVGLKATFGRVSVHGAVPVACSLDHLGPIAATAADAALTYAAIAGPDAKDPYTRFQPEPELSNWQNDDLSGLTLGIYRPWFQHADSEVVAICEALLAELVRRGARVREVDIPNLEDGRIAHTVTIAAEIYQAFAHTYANHRRDYGLDVRINLALAQELTARDYILAQRVRRRMMADLNAVLESVNAIVTPSTGITAPAISPSALHGGESDISMTLEIMRFMTPANLTGLPAISFPAGYGVNGLPIGMQAIGRAWGESTLLRLAHAAEGVVERRAPEIHFRLLPDENITKIPA